MKSQPPRGSRELRATLANRLNALSYRRHRTDAMVRVDNAGELGAVRIYDGQLAVLRHRKISGALRHMRDQERQRLA